jgi:type IV fimbrial biogenesis protein FimT
MKNKGFTLVELLVTISIMVIVMSIAVPSFSSLLDRNRLATRSNLLVSALNLARSEAVKRGHEVGVAALTRSGATNWAYGWNVATGDINQDNDRSDSGENAIIRVFEGLASGDTLTAQSGDVFIGFQSNGALDAQQCFTLRVDSGDSNRIDIARTGHISSSSGSCS